MEITSFSFLLYFLPIMLVGYFLLSRFTTARNTWLVLCGLSFYFLNGSEFALMLVVVAILNYVMGYGISRFVLVFRGDNPDLDRDSKDKAKKTARYIMVLSVIINITPLVIFVFLPQLLGNPTHLFEYKLNASFFAPFALAFLVLQGISYTADIYRGKAKWNSSILCSLVYFAMFPVVFGGPIIKYHEIAPQIENREINFDKISEGIGRLIIGLAKLCIIAEPLLGISVIVTDTSNLSGLYSSAPIGLILLGIACSLIGIYHLFSGFSDVAIGIGKMLGFSFPENFNHPHMATTVTAFWKRCYITLDGWFDEYIYGTLAKRSDNNDKMVLHLLIMWLLIGLWIGPSLPHLIFGFWNFAFILFERIVEMREKNRIPFFRHLYVMVVAVISVIALNASGMYQFTLYISNLFGMKGYGFQSDFAFVLLSEYWPIMLIGLITAFPIGTKLRQLAERGDGFFNKVHTVFYPIVMIVLVAFIVIKLSGVSFDPTQVFTTFLWRS